MYDFTASSEELSAVDYALSADMDPADLAAQRGSFSFDTSGTSGGIEAFQSSSSTIYATSKEDPWTLANFNATNLFSIYATYTPAGAGTAVKDIIGGGIIPFAR